MTAQVYFTNDGLGIVSVYSGMVSDADFIAACEFRGNHIEKMASVKYNIADLSKAVSINLTPQGMMNCARKARDMVLPHIDDLLYIAIINKKEQFGMMRMWTTLSANDHMTSHIVESQEEANQLITSHLHHLSIHQDIQWTEHH